MRRAGDTAALRDQGERLGRAGLSRRIISLVAEFQKNPTYIGAVILAGRLSAIATACKFDEYWREKSEDGFIKEMHILHDLPAPPLEHPDDVRAAAQSTT